MFICKYYSIPLADICWL